MDQYTLIEQSPYLSLLRTSNKTVQLVTTIIFVYVNSRLFLKAQILNIHTTALYHKVKLKA